MEDRHGPDRAAPPRRQKPAEKATEEARKLLGELLQARRGELGYLYRTTFSEDRGLHWRLVTDIEQAYRDTFTISTLAKVAQAYGVTRESVLAVLRGEAGELEPVDRPAAAPVPDPWEQARPRGRPGTLISPERVDEAERRYLPAVKERHAELAAAGVAEPSGQELFPGSPGLAGAYEADRLKGASVHEAAWTACLTRVLADERETSGHRSRHGSAGA